MITLPNTLSSICRRNLPKSYAWSKEAGLQLNHYGLAKERGSVRLKPRIVRIEDFYDIPMSGILTTSGKTASQTFQMVGDFYDFPTSGILTTSGNTASQTSQMVGDFYDVIGRIESISTLKVHPRWFPTSTTFTMSVNLAVLRIATVVRIPVSVNPRSLRFLGRVGTRLKDEYL